MATLAVLNESESSFSRMTKDGRKLTYELRVLQQPQRARACGSGAKSSADRRPVDPPPVIELKVFEGEQKTDITFNHKANFFVYTTLEAARPMAQPRGQPISQPPVLTGSPVSGAALLDRPSPAAYFIFPDLSVRHEGKYRLSFNLFEELKDVKDEDANAIINNPNHPGHGLLGSSPMAQQAHVHFRLEVRSKPFTVFSAKKFPGLAESTTLSRVVAEQGCRVRIRRDVRMRRRDKSGKDGDHDEVSSFPSYSEPPSADLYRQPSIEQLQQQHAAPQPQQPQQSIEHNYYSSSGYPTPQYSQHSQPPTYIPQTRPNSQQQYHPVQPSPVEQSPVQNPYAQGYNHYSQPHTRHPSISSHDGSAPHSAVLPPQHHQHQHQQQQPSHPQNMSQPQYSHPYTHYASDPMGLGTKSMFWADQHHTAQSLAVDHGHQYAPQLNRTATATEIRAATPNGTSLPPLKSIQPAATKPETKSQTPTMREDQNVPDVYGMSGMGNVNPASVAAQVRTGAKRGYDKVFDSGQSTGYSNGNRQDTCGQEIAHIATDEGIISMDELLNMKMVSYRRANGAMHTRRITSPNEA